ncbi:MAG: cell division protein ZapE [Trueperaceae bacterium]
MYEIVPLSELTGKLSAQLPASVPPPRFAQASFEGYRPAHSSQHEACQEVREFVKEVSTPKRFRSWPWGKIETGKGLYLDGGYGVGKTHLLAASFHAMPGSQKAYITFQELVHLIGVNAMAPAKVRLTEVSLLCLDEFELDDPGNTLIVKRFLEQIFAGGGSVMTTSNTPPAAQGSGRFNAQDFRREIQGIAGRFRAISLQGGDYRKREQPSRLLEVNVFERQLQDARRRTAVVLTDFPELLAVLRSLHPIHYRDLLSRMGTLFISNLQQIAQQNDALRFVHFIDQLYDQGVGLRVSGEVSLDDTFDPSYRHSAYQRKHERCISRLAELLEEPLAQQQPRQMERAQGFDR